MLKYFTESLESKGAEEMNMKPVFGLLFLISMLTVIGCYTKLGYYEPFSVNGKQLKHVEEDEKEMEHASDSDAVTDTDESEGYYGRRKSYYGSSYSETGRSYWVPYGAYPHLYYPPAYYYPHPWYHGYGYYPYGYRYYRSYYPYGGYYGRSYGRTYYPAFRGRTSNSATVLKGNRAEYRRSRNSRSVTSSNPRSERLKRSSRIRN